jgi:hypothetical protein
VNLRIAVGAILIIYGIIGLSIQFIPPASAYYAMTVSSFAGNPGLTSVASVLDPFSSSVLENLLWFGLCVLLGLVLVFYRKLVAKQKPPWLRPSVSEPKSLG